MKWWKCRKQKKEAIPHRIAPIPQIRDLRFTNNTGYSLYFIRTAQLCADKEDKGFSDGLTAKGWKKTAGRLKTLLFNHGSVELVHGVVFTARFQRGFTGKVFFVVVADV